ncbi:MAG TPA: acetate/propionate family kinase [Phycisphaerae bacterium]|nr:acetate/propionate family kinase [Phycisphaerae bacterium]
MPQAAPLLLTLNAGSSSIKFCAFTPALERELAGQIERIGSPRTRLLAHGPDGRSKTRAIEAADHAAAAGALLDFLDARLGKSGVWGIAHRVVHGGLHLLDHQRITPDVMEELRRSEPYDLAHLPRQIALIEACGKRFPELPQVACFDTAFFKDLPAAAQAIPLPGELIPGLRRLGFHGLSYTYLMSELERLAGAEAARGRVVLAHLGAGASLAALRDGRPADTTMGFTPLAGLVMGTRPGDIDPGLLVYLLRASKLSAEELDDVLSTESGMYAISGGSADMKDLLERRRKDRRAALAVEMFTYSARKFIAAMAAAVGGLDTLVFSGGIGEHAAEIRAEICGPLEFLNVRLDVERNAAHARVISTSESGVTVRVIATDEELVLARIALKALTIS